MNVSEVWLLVGYELWLELPYYFCSNYNNRCCNVIIMDNYECLQVASLNKAFYYIDARSYLWFPSERKTSISCSEIKKNLSLCDVTIEISMRF